MSGILQSLLASIGAAGGPWLYAWGYNGQGQLGDNTTVAKSSPVQIGEETTWSKIAVGDSGFTVSTKTNGTLWAWGENFRGQLGTGDTIDRSSPVQIGALTTWSEVTCGDQFSAAIKTDGTLWAWGYNYSGQLGDNTRVFKSSPVQVGVLTNWSKVSGRSSNCSAIKTDGTMWSWGSGYFGQLGIGIGGPGTYRSSPVQVGALTTWSQVSIGSSFGAAIKTDGTLWMWGYNGVGQLGDNTTYRRSSPIQVGALTNWSKVSGGASHCAAIKTDGTLWTWGGGGSGRLGNGQNANLSSPTQVGSLNTWSSPSAGTYATAVIKTDKTLWMFGGNSGGQLGDNTTQGKSSPIQIGSNTWSFVVILKHTLAIED